MITPVILSGGSGTRLWPFSRKAYPKQFLNLVGEESLFEKTVLRVGDKNIFNSPIIICNNEHRFLVAEKLQKLNVKPRSTILEPEGRNTAPAITVASIEMLKNEKDDIILIMPSDHLIENVERFIEVIKKAEKLAKDGYLVTFGIIPHKPETGFGYIEKREEINDFSFGVKKFTEKPDKKSAKKFISSGNFYWNSGIFMFKVSKYLEIIRKFESDMFTNCKEAYDNATKDLDFIRLEEKSFSKCKDISIDYAVMEKTDNIVVIPIDVGWDDIGSWEALYKIGEKDSEGNVKGGDSILYKTKNCFVKSQKGLVVTIGVENLVIVNSEDVILVVNRKNVQEVKKIVEILKKKERMEHVLHKKVYRPWGSYEEMDSMPGFKVKRLTVKPGGKLSLQRHNNRAEHWVIVKGEATVVCGEEELTLSKDESIYISKGKKHRLSNFGDTMLEVIEVQTGDYLEEDDIERFEDIYGRNK